MAAAGQGAVGLRSRGGRRGCTKRFARKASGWEQEKRASEERTEGEGGSLGKALEQARPGSRLIQKVRWNGGTGDGDGRRPGQAATHQR